MMSYPNRYPSGSSSSSCSALTLVETVSITGTLSLFCNMPLIFAKADVLSSPRQEIARLEVGRGGSQCAVIATQSSV